jgi:hypothetical protein
MLVVMEVKIGVADLYPLMNDIEPEVRQPGVGPVRVWITNSTDVFERPLVLLADVLSVVPFLQHGSFAPRATQGKYRPY